MKLEKIGLGYSMAVVDEGVNIAIDRLVESRGELFGELVVTATGPGHLLRGRYNLSSITTRNTTSKALTERLAGVGWRDLLEIFCSKVLDAHRTGSPVVVIGKQPARPAPEWVLDPLLIRHEPTILYGEGGTGKSTLAAAVAVSVASGVPAFEGWKVNIQRPVLVLDWEADAAAWNDLIATSCDSNGIEPPDVFYRPSAGSLPGQVHEIARQVTEREVGLLIIDSVGLASPMAREGADASEGALRLFDALRTIGIASLLIDHVSKSQMGTQESVGPYGSVYKVNSARSMYELRAGKEADEGSGDRHLALIHRKHNLTPKQDTVGIRVQRTPESLLLLREEVMDDKNLSPGLTLAERITRYLSTERPMTTTQISSAIGADQASVKTTLHRSKRFHQVGHEGKAAVWHLVSDR